MVWLEGAAGRQTGNVGWGVEWSGVKRGGLGWVGLGWVGSLVGSGGKGKTLHSSLYHSHSHSHTPLD